MTHTKATTQALLAAVSTTKPLEKEAAEYLEFAMEMTPTKANVDKLQHLARQVTAGQVEDLLPLIRALCINRCAATLYRARSNKQMHPAQLRGYERYLNLAQNGKSLLELTLRDHYRLSS